MTRAADSCASGRATTTPDTGRWTAKDPVLITAGEANLYAYVRNDPVNLRDVTGLQQLKDFDQQQKEKKNNACPPPKELKPPPGMKKFKEYQDVRKEVAGDKSAGLGEEPVGPHHGRLQEHRGYLAPEAPATVTASASAAPGSRDFRVSTRPA